MMPQLHSLCSSPFPAICPSIQVPKSLISSVSYLPTRRNKNFSQIKQNLLYKSCYFSTKCSVSLAEATSKVVLTKPSSAEVCRTIMELSSVGTLSTLIQEEWPIGIGVRFVVEKTGIPALCLNPLKFQNSLDTRCSLHVQLDQCGSRTPQCTLQGILNKPEDRFILKNIHTRWARRFNEEVDENLLYVIDVDQVLVMDDFRENGSWITSTEYKNANPDPLRDFAEEIVNNMNAKHSEDVQRFCSVYVDLNFQPKRAKVIWIDRLGFDVHIFSEKDTYEARIPFPREVTDEKGAKSSFNCMSQLAWEIEKNYSVPDFQKVKYLKHIR